MQLYRIVITKNTNAEYIHYVCTDSVLQAYKHFESLGFTVKAFVKIAESLQSFTSQHVKSKTLALYRIIPDLSFPYYIATNDINTFLKGKSVISQHLAEFVLELNSDL